MMRHLSGVDHAVVAVRDLARACSDFERLGFQVTPRGRHDGQGTANHCLMFADDYVELLGILEPDRGADGMQRFLQEREGLAAIALHSEDPEGTHAAWRDAGLEPAGVAEVERLIEPDLRLRFKDVSLAPEATLGIPLFACAPLTPDLMRRPDWLDHPNGALGICSITIVVDDPMAFAAPMGAVFGSTRLTDTDDTLAVHTGRGVLLFVTPDDLAMLHPEVEALAGNGRPTIAALTLTVADAEATAALLERNRVAYRRDAGGAVGVGPGEAHGVMLEFRPQGSRAPLI